MTLDTTQLARLLNMTPRQVQRLKAEGVLILARDEFGDEKRGRWEMVPNVHAYIKYLKGYAKLDDASESTRLQLTNKRLAADAEMAVLRLQEYKGTLHRSADVEFVWTQKVTAFKARVQAIASRISRLLVGQTKYPVIFDTITTETDLCLREMSEYDSTNFRDKSEQFLSEQGAIALGVNGEGESNTADEAGE